MYGHYYGSNNSNNLKQYIPSDEYWVRFCKLKAFQ